MKQKTGGFQAGKYLGGIRDLQSVMDRCRIDEVTHCWNWSQCTGQSGGAPRGYASFPWLDTPISTTIRRAVVAYETGAALKNGWRVWSKCGNSLCCNPSHIGYGPTEKWGEALAKSGVHKNNPRKIAANRKTVLRFRKLTEEQAMQVRESEKTCTQLAEELGVCVNTISMIRLNRSYKQTKLLPGASIFAQAAA